MNAAKEITYIESSLQICKMILEGAFDFCPRCLATRDLDTVCRTRCNIDHLLELWVLEGLYGLQHQWNHKWYCLIIWEWYSSSPDLLRRAIQLQLDERPCRCRGQLVLIFSSLWGRGPGCEWHVQQPPCAFWHRLGAWTRSWRPWPNCGTCPGIRWDRLLRWHSWLTECCASRWRRKVVTSSTNIFLLLRECCHMWTQIEKAGNSRAKLASTVLFLFPIDELHNSRMEKLLHIPPFFFACLSPVIDLLNVDIQKEAVRISCSGISKRGAFLFFRYVHIKKKHAQNYLKTYVVHQHLSPRSLQHRHRQW